MDPGPLTEASTFWISGSRFKSRSGHELQVPRLRYLKFSSVTSIIVAQNRACVDKKNQLDVTFCILYFSSNSCSTCFAQPCAHRQELTTA